MIANLLIMVIVAGYAVVSRWAAGATVGCYSVANFLCIHVPVSTVLSTC